MKEENRSFLQSSYLTNTNSKKNNKNVSNY